MPRSLPGRPRRPLLAVGVALGCLVALGWPRLAPATVTEQRQRLPPVAECDDPVEGVWMAHIWHPAEPKWELATMELRRVAPGSPELTSKYQAEIWNGTAGESRPPPCRPSLYHFIHHSTGVGRYEPPRKLSVRGTALGPAESLCGGQLSRALGELTGELDESIHEFQSTMTSRFGVEPMVWRRVSCLGAKPAASGSVAVPPASPAPPPATTPPARKRGSCGCAQPGRP